MVPVEQPGGMSASLVENNLNNLSPPPTCHVSARLCVPLSLFLLFSLCLSLSLSLNFFHNGNISMATGHSGTIPAGMPDSLMMSHSQSTNRGPQQPY